MLINEEFFDDNRIDTADTIEDIERTETDKSVSCLFICTIQDSADFTEENLSEVAGTMDLDYTVKAIKHVIHFAEKFEGFSNTDIKKIDVNFYYDHSYSWRNFEADIDYFPFSIYGHDVNTNVHDITGKQIKVKASVAFYASVDIQSPQEFYTMLRALTWKSKSEKGTLKIFTSVHPMEEPRHFDSMHMVDRRNHTHVEFNDFSVAEIDNGFLKRELMDYCYLFLDEEMTDRFIEYINRRNIVPMKKLNKTEFDWN